MASAICFGRGLFGKIGVTYGQYSRGAKCRSSIRICSGTGSRLGLTSSPSSNCRRASSPTRRTRLASVRGSASPCVRTSGCSCGIRSTSRGSCCRANLITATTSIRTSSIPSRPRAPLATTPAAYSAVRVYRHRELLLGRRSVAGGEVRAGERGRPYFIGRLLAHAQHGRQQRNPTAGTLTRVQAGFRRRGRGRQVCPHQCRRLGLLEVVSDVGSPARPVRDGARR